MDSPSRRRQTLSSSSSVLVTEGAASPKMKRYVALANSSESNCLSLSPGPLLHFQKGDVLIRFKHQEHIPGWIFCQSEDGSNGWVPLPLVERYRSSTPSERHSDKLVSVRSSPGLGRSSPEVSTRAKKRSSDLSSIAVYIKVVKVIDAVAVISAVASEVNEKVRCSEKTLALLQESRDKEKLAKFVTADRTVLSYLKDVEVKIEQTKSSGLGKLKADVYILSDSLLLLLRKTVRSDLYSWIEDFSYIFWPMNVVWVSRDTRGPLLVIGPLLSVTLTVKPQKNESNNLAEVLVSESTKHSNSTLDPNARKGQYVFYETGIKYNGDWRLSSSGALMDGHGLLSLPNGMSYSGSFVKNEMSGRGQMSLPSGDVMIGAFENGVLSGDGVVDYSNGDVFKGAFVNGVRTGHGVFRCAVYEYNGEWALDNPSGKGRLRVGTSRFDGVFANGVFVSGEYISPDEVKFCGDTFVRFSLLDGVGTATYSNGSKFSGNWKLGLKEGEGKFEYLDGSILVGSWKHDVANGTMKWTGGTSQWLKSYEGAYVDGVPHAKNGEAVFSDGSRFKGSFKCGMIGTGEMTLADGSVVVGKFKGNHVVGKGCYALADGGEGFDGVPDASFRMPVKRAFMSLQLYVSRPSFPINIAEGAVFKK